MSSRGSLIGLTFCTCYLASYLMNKYVLSVLKFTYPTLFQGWQTFIGGLLLHVSWKLGWVEINSSLRSDVLTWLPASILFVGIIYAGSRALSRLAVPVFLILHNAAEVIICGYQKCFWKEKTSPAKICSALFLLAAAGCLPFNDSQFDPDGYFWAVIHLLCVGAYKILRKFQKPSALSDIDQQYLNYIFSVVFLAFAAHPTGDLFSVLDFPFLYFYRFHGSCCASETKEPSGPRTVCSLDFLCSDQENIWTRNSRQVANKVGLKITPTQPGLRDIKRSAPCRR
ncbi:UDP-N-acetylglucosamine transporter TMEM241 isoform X4 [Ictidomys tridecemlineatus]